MLERFQGKGGERRLIEAFLAQTLVCNDREIAEELVRVSELREFQRGDAVIKQDGADNDVFLIVAGELAIRVNGREVARRRAGQHVGELAVLDPRAPRSASVIAIELSVLAQVTEVAFTSLCDKFPELWRRLALELGHRLSERNSFVDEQRERPLLFIGASVEGLSIARELQAALRHDAVSVRVWTDNVFSASQFPIDELELLLKIADFGVLVATPDDVVHSRGSERLAPRDNVIFELGLVMGALSRSRSFVVRPHGADLKLPTDLLGLTSLDYDANESRPIAERLAPIANDIRRLVVALGPR